MRTTDCFLLDHVQILHADLSLLFLEPDGSVYLFTAVWSPVSPDMVDSYSIIISQV